jgi:hypothetical protein
VLGRRRKKRNAKNNGAAIIVHVQCQVWIAVTTFSQLKNHRARAAKGVVIIVAREDLHRFDRPALGPNCEKILRQNIVSGDRSAV